MFSSFGALDKPFAPKASSRTAILRVGSKLPKQLDAISNHKSWGLIFHTGLDRHPHFGDGRMTVPPAR